MINFAKKKQEYFFPLVAMMLLLLSGCGAGGNPGSPGEGGGKLRVMATTTILGDVVDQIGGQAIDLTVLMAPGTDPHTFEPAPQDLTAIAQADLIFVSGAGLEAFLNNLLENAREEAKVVSVSEGIDLRHLEDEHAGDEDEEHEADGVDPHVWFDPTNVVVWTQNIEQALSDLDPANAQIYASNAEEYRRQLEDLDRWIQEQVQKLPKENRKLVTDHQVFGYFAGRYGFEQVGAVIPSFSAGAEPSAQQIAQLEDTIRELDVPAIFVGKTVNPNLAERIASDTGVRLVSLYTGSLTGPGGEADSYITLMQYDITAIVNALIR